MPKVELTSEDLDFLASLVDAKRHEASEQAAEAYEAGEDHAKGRQAAEYLSRLAWYLKHPWLDRPDCAMPDLDFLLD